MSLNCQQSCVLLKQPRISSSDRRPDIALLLLEPPYCSIEYVILVKATSCEGSMEELGEVSVTGFILELQ